MTEYVDTTTGPRVLGTFEDNRPIPVGFHDPVPESNIDYWHGIELKKEDRSTYNLYMKTLADNTYEIGFDTNANCNSWLYNPPQSEELKQHSIELSAYTKKLDECQTSMNRATDESSMQLAYINWTKSLKDMDDFLKANPHPYLATYILRYCN